MASRVLPLVPLVEPVVPMVPILPTTGCHFCTQPRAWTKLPMQENDVIQDGVVNARFKTRRINTIFPIMLKANEKKCNFLMPETSIQHVSTSKLLCKSFIDQYFSPMVPLTSLALPVVQLAPLAAKAVQGCLVAIGTNGS